MCHCKREAERHFDYRGEEVSAEEMVLQFGKMRTSKGCWPPVGLEGTGIDSPLGVSRRI